MGSSSTLLVAIVIVSLVSVTTGQFFRIRDNAPPIGPNHIRQRKSEALCKEMVKDPNFEPDMVVGTPWRVYYIWNMQIASLCIDITFKIATPMLIRRFYYDMHEYLEEQPAWGAASLLLKMGKAQREMMLFDDQGSAGKFIAVPNVMRDSGPRMPPLKRGVPLLKFQMKLTTDGKYLIFMDCQVGIASIAAKIDQPVDRAEIDSIAATFSEDFGKGYHACVVDKVEDELKV